MGAVCSVFWFKRGLFVSLRLTERKRGRGKVRERVEAETGSGGLKEDKGKQAQRGQQHKV